MERSIKNPWVTHRCALAQTVKMTRCLPHCCIGCQTDCKVERNAKRRDIEWINACRTGPFPAFVEDANEEDELMSEPSHDPESNFPDEPLEEGDRIWATRLFSEAEHICMTATVSNC